MLDYFGLENELSPQEQQIRDQVRAFLREQIEPVVGHHFLEGTPIPELPKRLGELGVLGANLRGYGCGGVGEVAYGLMMRELERCDSAVRSFASVQGSLCMYGIWAFGCEEQKAHWLPRLASGQAVGGFALTEPNAGSNPSAMDTRATKQGNDYVLEGHKRWITNGTLADVLLVWAKVEGDIRGFLVPKGRPGVTIRKIQNKFSLRASDSAEAVFRNVRLGAEEVLPGVSSLRGPLSCLTQARLGICFGAVGAAEACYASALQYARERVAFDKPIAGHQLVQAKLVDMVTAVTQSQLMALRLGRLKEAGLLRPEQVSLVKRANVGAALGVARSARDILGANGITYDYPVSRHLLNLETVSTYEGTHDIHTLIVGSDITGLPAFA